MTLFEIPAMTGGHCVNTITQAVQSIDPDARVQADLATKSIVVANTANMARLSAAIAAAGNANTATT